MDWRLTAALASFSGSLGLVAIVAVPFFAEQPSQPKKVPAAPAFPERTVSGGQVAASRTPSLTAYSTQNSPLLEQRVALYTPVALNTEDPRVNAPQRPASRIARTAVPALPQGESPLLVTPPSAKPLSTGPRAAPPVSEQRYQGILTEGEIARIRNSLRLTPEQAVLWPPVHSALSEMGRQQLAQIKNGQKPQIMAEDWPPQKLYGVAGPLIKVLRPEQKDQVRALCRSLGFQMVASLI